ncbi:MAG: hypothetical protein KatS3mg109_1759 [Pirellulaceae bacterium]|nr:MAG: hypothetical protein KatS3mg109_1759 [Pirellulaceae bacterium]GIW92189.1 MAG: hypothetical protein KatS3mg110_0230 [Pirellulaceae bacterium]
MMDLKPPTASFSTPQSDASVSQHRMLSVVPLALPDHDTVELAERVIEAARQRLQTSGYYALRHVQCKRSGTTLVLCGRVPSFYQKQLAQSLVMDLVKATVIERIDNQVQVAE